MDSVFFSVAVAVCFAVWCVVVRAYRDYISELFGVLRDGAAGDRMLDKQTKIFGNFLDRTIALGLFALGLACLRFAAGAAVPPEAGSLPSIAAACWAAIAAAWGWQYLALKAAGALTLYGEFTGRLFYLKKMVTATAAIAVVPVFLLFALAGGTAAVALGWVIVGLGGVAVVFLVISSFMLFVRQRFSISLWILYLCAVEIFPVSAMVVLAGKLLA